MVRFTYYEDAGGEWRWRLVAANNRIIAESGEGYTDEFGVRRAIDMIREFGQMLRLARATRMERKPKKVSPLFSEAVESVALENFGELAERAKVAAKRARKK